MIAIAPNPHTADAVDENESAGDLCSCHSCDHESLASVYFNPDVDLPRTKRRRSLAVDRLSLGCPQIRIGNACCSGTLRAVEYPGLVELAINAATATDRRVRIQSPVRWSSQDFTTKGESLMTHPWINILTTSLNELEQSCCFFS